MIFEGNKNIPLREMQTQIFLLPADVDWFITKK